MTDLPEADTAAPLGVQSGLPYLTGELPAIPGAIKRRYEDFVVEEIPAYEPCGQGDHVFFVIEKTGLATMRAVNDVARALGVAPRHIGVAGLKDARGVTRQMLSLEHIDPARVEALSIPRIRVVSVSRHGNKLRIGHLRGNRFCIKLRESDPARLPDARAALDVLGRRGVPNYFGPQRFGSRGDTWEIGRALLREDYRSAVELIAGRPGPHDTGAVLKARRLFADGRYADAAAAWPYGFRECVHICRTLARPKSDPRRAIFGLDRKLQGFYVSAYQSWLFNHVLAARLDAFDRVLTGDLAYKEDHGAIFPVENAEVEQPRAERFEISPTGPLFGHRMTEPSGEPAAIEQRVLDACGASRDEFPRGGALRCSGGRRPLRFRASELSIDADADRDGPYLELRFVLPSGCYATSLLRELCKEKMEVGLADEG